MDYQILVLVMLFIVIFISSLLNQTPKSSKPPPGPTPFPIIGNILELGRYPHKSLTKLSKTYGPLMTLKLGSITTIVISSPQIAKKVLIDNGQVFSKRTIPHVIQVLDHHKVSVSWLPPSTQWRNLRKVCAAKIFSPLKLDSMQNLRQKKVLELLDFVKERCIKGEVLDIGEAAFTTVLNLISNTLFSMDLSHFASNEKSQKFSNIIWGVMEEAARPNVVDFFPILCPLDPQRVHARMSGYFKELFEIFDGITEERMHSKVSKSDSKGCCDVLDSFIDIIEEDSSQMNRKEMLHLLLDLFVAGIDTTSTTLEWTMAELLHNPEKLTKARNELHQVIGKDVTIEESHISKLPFLRAVVKETLRLHPSIPLLLPHKSDETVEICDFKVPKNAKVLVNVWAIGRDPSIWENPNMFVPERFLECDIDYRGHDFELIPFGAGKRICPGLPLAQRIVHLIVASLVHNYEWELADGVRPEQMDMEEQYGLSLKKIQPLRVQAIPINHSTH